MNFVFEQDKTYTLSDIVKGKDIPYTLIEVVYDDGTESNITLSPSLETYKSILDKYIGKYVDFQEDRKIDIGADYTSRFHKLFIMVNIEDSRFEITIKEPDNKRINQIVQMLTEMCALFTSDTCRIDLNDLRVLSLQNGQSGWVILYTIDLDNKVI